ncbi:vesicle-associated protein 2-1-like [Tasmannia lanceolata]|uniref:vesicle-associated protein 2-1-like n=1 Tax=Tasmannia lanceolata TaxID=3420 RepID=UPI004063A0B0
MSSGQLISYYPEELTFQVELGKQCYCDLKVVNNTEHHVAFKVKTTSPKKYFVRPNTGILQPSDSCVVTVTLQAQLDYPPDMQCKDKFLLQSTKVPPSTDIDEIPQEIFSKDGDRIIEECKLRVVYTAPVHSDNGDSESEPLVSASMLSSSNQSSDNTSTDNNASIEEIRALQCVKEERESVLQQNQLLQQELEMLRRRKNRRSDAGFSLVFAAFVGIIGVMVGFLLNLALSGPSNE